MVIVLLLILSALWFLLLSFKLLLSTIGENFFFKEISAGATGFEGAGTLVTSIDLSIYQCCEDRIEALSYRAESCERMI